MTMYDLKRRAEELAIRAIKRGNYKRALELIQNLVATYPDSSKDKKEKNRRQVILYLV